MGLKLYTSRLAPNPRRVAWVMAEKQIEDIEVIEVNLLAGEHRQPDYRNRFGLSHLPGLELEDGTGMTETLAISRYLESRYPEPNLFGTDDRETALIEMWTRRAEIYLANPVMMYVRMTHPALSVLEAPQPEVAAYNLAMAERFMKTLDRHLEGKDYIASDRFTIADIVAYVGLDFGRLVKYRAPETLENLMRWTENVRLRPACNISLQGKA